MLELASWLATNRIRKDIGLARAIIQRQFKYTKKVTRSGQWQNVTLKYSVIV